MKQIRIGLAALVMLALAAGYAKSQIAWFNREAPAYAASVDTPAVKGIALLVLLVVAAFAFVRDREPDPEADSE